MEGLVLCTSQVIILDLNFGCARERYGFVYAYVNYRRMRDLWWIWVEF